MKFILRKDEDEGKEKEVEFWLRETDGAIELLCQVVGGGSYKTYHILRIDPAGELSRSGGLSSDLGLELDERGKVREVS